MNNRVLLITVALIAIIAGVFYYTQNHTTKITALDSYAGWKTYAGADFSFKYPADWDISVSPVRGSCGIVVSISPKNLPPGIASAFINPPSAYEIGIFEITVSVEKCVEFQDFTYAFGSKPYNYLKTDTNISSGLFSGKYMTFISSSNKIKNIPNSLPDMAILTNNSYDGSAKTILDKGVVSAEGKTFEISLNARDKEEYPALFNVNIFNKSSLYVDTLLILNSLR